MKELVLRIAAEMESRLVFKTGKIADLENRLKELATALDGFRRSFQCIFSILTFNHLNIVMKLLFDNLGDIQDYVNIQGLRIWQEEFSRIVNFYVEQECNVFLKKKVLEWQSGYQDEAIPIPVYKYYFNYNIPLTNAHYLFCSSIDESVNMIGRFTRELINQTSCRRTMYQNHFHKLECFFFLIMLIILFDTKNDISTKWVPGSNPTQRRNS